MKKLLASFALLALFGAGCLSSSMPKDTVATTHSYENTQYGFAFTYPDAMEVHVRSDATRKDDYLGLDADFFVSLRDVKRDKKPTNIAYFYAVPGLTVDRFKASLEASDPASVKVTNSEEIAMNGTAMTKVTSTTAMGTDKIHYLFDRSGTTIVVSVFLAEETAWNPVLQSLSSL